MKTNFIPGSRGLLCALLVIVTLPLPAFAGEVTVTNPNPEPLLVERALSHEKMFTKVDDVKILGRIVMGDSDLAQNKNYYECNSFTIEEKGNSSVWIRHADLSVAKSINIGGNNSGFQLQMDSSLQWKETLTIEKNGSISNVMDRTEMHGGSLVLNGRMEIMFYSPDAIDQFANAGVPLIPLTGRLETTSGAAIEIRLTGSAGDTQLPAGEYTLIASKDFSGDLPQVKITEGNPNQKLSLKKTSKGLILVVK